MPSIYVTGFNAHNQLTALSSDTSSSSPEDVRAWTKILHGDDARILFAGWSSTVLQLNNALHFYGHLNGTKSRYHSLSLTISPSPSDIRAVVGDRLNGPLAILTTTGHLHTLNPSPPNTTTLHRLGNEDSPTLSAISIAGNDQIAITMLQASGSKMIHLLLFPSYVSFTEWYANPSSAVRGEGYTHHMLPGRVKEMLAGATCFFLLTEGGEVFSWGDRRYPSCLGRSPSPDSPAEAPGLVSALGGIPITKLTGCAWAFAALSESGDVYLWGRDKPSLPLNDGQEVLAPLLGGKDEEVKLLEGAMFEDVRDVALGNGFVVVVNAAGEVWGIGENGSGQLGVEELKVVKDWRKLARVEPEEFVAVVAGDASSFLVVDGELQPA